jgi:hypothetical protein
MTFFLSQFTPSCQSLVDRYSYKYQYVGVIIGEITQPGMKFELAMGKGFIFGSSAGGQIPDLC